MGDQLTVLRCSPNLSMAKTYRQDGTIIPYSSAKHFDVTLEEVANVLELSVILSGLESDPRACVIRGTPTDPSDLRGVRRLAERFTDAPLHSVLIEVDQFAPLVCDPVQDPEGAALEYIAECLPAAFHNVSFHLQMSNSAGTAGKQHLLKAHLWFWLETPYDSATLKAWAKAEQIALDRAVFQVVQPHYTAAPIFEAGVPDPVAQRSNFYRGARDDVPLVIDTERLDIKTQRARQRGADREVDDPIADWLEGHWETWGPAGGGFAISCPFADGHSSGAPGDTSTAYLPAGTSGYAEGFFKCLHSSCESRSQAEFQEAVGYSEQRFAALAVRTAEVAETDGPHLEGATPYLNGHALKDPLLLPPFRRDGKGGIYPDSLNLKAALRHSPMSGIELRFDAFREEMVWSTPGADAWQPFIDKHYTDVKLKLETKGFLPIPRDELRQMVRHTAEEATFDTAQIWLEGLAWDGVARVETFWIDHFGVLDDPLGYARAVGRYTWSAMAGRVLRPGVQADMVPVLSGPQGLRKSRGIVAMAPGREFATTMSFHEPEVERARKMRGVLLVELAELQGLKTREREEILAWVTRSTEHWTPKWLESSRTFHRRSLLIATTNDDDFLDNPDGERRWLPLGVGKAPGFGMVDDTRLEAVRDQLWAEGAARFATHGVEWQDAERLARDVHGAYKADDSWSGRVTSWLERADMTGATPRDRAWISIGEVMEDALSLPPYRQNRAMELRVAKLLRDEGYEKVNRMIDGKQKKVWLRPGAAVGR